MTPQIVMTPAVSVPVLSSATTRIRRAASSACALLTGCRARHRGRPRRPARRGGQAERARAGDHQDGDGRAPGGGGGQPGAQPEPEGRGGQGDHAGHEDGGDPVGEPLRAGLGACAWVTSRVIWAEQRVRADPGGAHNEAAAHVHGAPGDRVVRPDLCGHGFPGERGTRRRPSCPRRTTPSVAIFSPGADDELLPGGEFAHRYPVLGSRRAARRRSWRRGRPARSAPTTSDPSRGLPGSGPRARRW